MKDSGISYVGRIPSNWVQHPVYYYFYEGKEPNNSCKEENLLSLSYGNVIKKDINTSEGLLPASFSTYNIVDANDIIIRPTDLQNDKRSLRTGLVKEKGIITSAYIDLKPKSGVNSHFYHYLLHAYDVMKVFYNMGNGVRQGLNYSEFSKLILISPPIDEQKRIADFLDKECAKIDSIYADVEKQIEILEQYKRSVITEAVTKGLDKSVKFKKTNVVWASKIPIHWSTMPNKYIMSKIKRICDIHNGEDIISLSMNGVIVRDLDAGGKMPTTFNGYQFVYPGNLLMCLFDYDVTPRCIGYIGNYGITSPAYSQFVMKNNNSAKYYYYYYLMIDNTKELLHLAKNLRHSFTEDELGKIVQVVPPIKEQQAIADYLDKKCAEIESIIADKKKQLDVLESYKKSIIYEYVTGKKEVV